MKITFQEPQNAQADALVVVVADGNTLSAAAEQADSGSSGAVARALEASRFNGKDSEKLDLLGVEGAGAARLVLAGIGKPAEASPKSVSYTHLTLPTRS